MGSALGAVRLGASRSRARGRRDESFTMSEGKRHRDR